MKSIKKTEIAMVFVLVFAIVFHLCAFFAVSHQLTEDVLRLHILANSDSEEDQALKLKVRDAVLKEGKALFEGASTVEEAKKCVAENLKRFEEIALRVLKKEGCAHSCKAALVNTFFGTRYYDNFTMPAGNYDALQIVLGKGEGHNWWCVVFPQMCLGFAGNFENADAFSAGEMELLEANPQFEVRFKCVEIYERIKNNLKKS